MIGELPGEDRLMTMAELSFWRRRAPIWLRVLLGLLILPVIWICFALILEATLPPIKSPLGNGILLVAGAVVAGVVSWIIARKASGRIAVVFTPLVLLVYVMVLLAAIPAYQSYKPKEQVQAPPQTEAPANGDGSLGVDGGSLSGGGNSFAEPEKAHLPEFPWPPPAASASYVLPDALLAGYQTVGEATTAILSALERNGYVERSFFRTQDGGVALVTRLERINDDGSPSAEAVRWPATAQAHGSTRSLFDFLRGLFYVDPGHYRVIVFILQDLPFSQSSETITAAEAKAWLASGANVLPPEIAEQPFAGAHCTVLIYEFASDGKTVRVIESSLTGKGHLEKAGLLASLDNAE